MKFISLLNFLVITNILIQLCNGTLNRCKWIGSGVGGAAGGVSGNDKIYDGVGVGGDNQEKDDDNTSLNGLTTTTTLSCKLRSWNTTNDYLFVNLNQNEQLGVRVLLVKCSGDGLYLEELFIKLKNLINLIELKIENCKVRLTHDISFTKLRKLTINTRTSVGDNGWDLGVRPTTFNSLTSLYHLNLAENSLRTIKSELFCSLFSLKILNLTRNHISQIHQNLDGCSQGIEILDLTDNFISHLPDDNFVYFKNLLKLNLERNHLKQINEFALRGLHSLKIVNLSNNNITIVSENAFKTIKKLVKLNLSNNSIKLLPSSIFNSLTNLDEINLANNQLNFDLTNEIFLKQKNLKVLNVGFNQLTKIDKIIFSELINLQILNLEFNQIRSIVNSSFFNLINLKLLILTGNKMKRIDSHHFNGLATLNQLFLDSNHIEHIHQRSFVDLVNLNELSLNQNRLIVTPNCFENLKTLRSLDLGNNLLKFINLNDFIGLTEILGLRLTGNLIKKIHENSFRELINIQVLNLASNQLKRIEKLTFKYNNQLRALRLDNNQLNDIQDLLINQESLVWLNISDNNLSTFDYNDIPDALEWIDLHRNNISVIKNTVTGNVARRSSLFQLKYLDISLNQIKTLNTDSILNSIETLLINNNLINEINDGTFLNKQNLIKVNLRNNQLRKFNIAALSLTTKSVGTTTSKKNTPNFYLANNPIHCDCTMEWIQKINRINGNYPNVIDLNSINCTMELKKRGTNSRGLMSLKSNEFLCGYTTHCFALCHCCEYDACDCKMTCPDGCNCYYNHAWSSNIVNCGNLLYKDIPKRIPMDATIIYLDGNNLNQLGNHLFIGKKRLEELYLNNSNIHNLHNRTFSGLNKLKILNLNYNKLERILLIDFDLLNDLKELYLSHNRINFIERNTFVILKSLQILTLTNNRLKSLDYLIPLAQLTDVQLEIFDGNQFDCHCHVLEKLIKFQNQIKCTSGGGGLTLYSKCTNNLQKQSSSPPLINQILLDTNNELSNTNGLIGGEYVPIGAAILVGIMSTILVIILLCTLRNKLRLFLYSKYGIRIFENSPIIIDDCLPESEKSVDGHIIFSCGDTDFMYRILGAEIQNQGYTISLYQSDMSDESIQKAHNLSKRLVILISLNFIQDWSKETFSLPLYNAINKIKTQMRRHRIIIIIAAPLDIVMSNNYLEELIKTSTVLFWGEKRFWDKFRYSMPDINCHKTVRKKKNNNSSHSSSGTLNICSGGGHGGCSSSNNGTNNKRIEYSYVTMKTGKNKFESQTTTTTNHLYSTIPEASNGRAYFV